MNNWKNCSNHVFNVANHIQIYGYNLGIAFINHKNDSLKKVN